MLASFYFLNLLLLIHATECSCLNCKMYYMHRQISTLHSLNAGG